MDEHSERPGSPRSYWEGEPELVMLATRNAGKLEELSAMLQRGRFRLVGPEYVAKLPRVTEDGATFTANARKKAIHYSRHASHLVIADDSGLEIDALGGEPGVRSARLGGSGASDNDRVWLVLRKMEGVPWEKRTARFHCVIAIALKGEVLATFHGSCEGIIALEPAGSDGFGYDPIFFFPPMNRTFAEMSRIEKELVSHRGQALQRAVAWLHERGQERDSSR